MFEPILTELNDRLGVTIDFQFNELPYENMKRQLTTRIGGGNPPDIASIDQIWLGSFIDSGAIMRIDSVVDRLDFDDYLPAFRSPVQHDDSVYGIPITTDVRGMYWNKDAFESAGLDPEVPPETWTDLFEFAEKLHDPPRRYGTAYFVVGGRWLVNLFAAGGEVVSPDGSTPEFHRSPGIEAASFVGELYTDRSVGPPEPIYSDGAQMARAFLDGQYAINIIEGSWLDFFWRNMGNENDGMIDRFGFAPTPRPVGGTAATMSGGFAWTGFEATDHPEIVQEFLHVAGSREFNRHLAIQSRDVPTRESLLKDDEVWDGILYGDTIREMVKTTRTRPARHWPLIASELDPALQRVAFGRADPKTALEEAAERVKSELS